MERGRYTSYSQRQTPHRKRTIHLSGSFEDRGKWIRCWNCGFIVNVDRDLGDPEQPGVEITDAIVQAQTLEMGGTAPNCSMDNLDMVGTLIKQDASGTAITDYYTPRLAEVSRGCPFCGTNNL